MGERQWVQDDSVASACLMCMAAHHCWVGQMSQAGQALLSQTADKVIKQQVCMSWLAMMTQTAARAGTDSCGATRFLSLPNFLSAMAPCGAAQHGSCKNREMSVPMMFMVLHEI